MLDEKAGGRWGVEQEFGNQGRCGYTRCDAREKWSAGGTCSIIMRKHVLSKIGLSAVGNWGVPRCGTI